MSLAKVSCFRIYLTRFIGSLKKQGESLTFGIPKSIDLSLNSNKLLLSILFIFFHNPSALVKNPLEGSPSKGLSPILKKSLILVFGVCESMNQRASLYSSSSTNGCNGLLRYSSGVSRDARSICVANPGLGCLSTREGGAGVLEAVLRRFCWSPGSSGGGIMGVSSFS